MFFAIIVGYQNFAKFLPEISLRWQYYDRAIVKCEIRVITKEHGKIWFYTIHCGYSNFAKFNPDQLETNR